METEGRSLFKSGVIDCLPTVAGYIGIGIACGVVGKASGLSVLYITLMSVFIYAGSAQFIICSMLALKSPASAIILTTFLVNSRLILMGMTTATYFKKEPVRHSVGIGTLLTDETFGVAMNQVARDGKLNRSWMNGVNVAAYSAWIFSTLIGAVIGNFIPDPAVLGLDFALPAMFIGLSFFQIESRIKIEFKKTIIIVVCVAVGVYLLMGIASPEIALIIASMIGCVIGVGYRE